MVSREFLKVQHRELRSPEPGKEKPHAPVYSRGHPIFCRKGPGYPGEHQIKISHKHAPVAKKATKMVSWAALGKVLPAE